MIELLVMGFGLALLTSMLGFFVIPLVILAGFIYIGSVARKEELKRKELENDPAA